MALAAGFMVAITLGLTSSQAADLKNVRFGPAKDATRIVFDIAGTPHFVISGDSTGMGRLYVDFTSLNLGSSGTDYKPGKGHVARYGFARRDKTHLRAVLELKKTAKIKEVFVLEPKGAVTHHRLVIDLQTGEKADFMASLPRAYGDLTAMIE